jgi:N-acetylneuraminate synthase|tara:strand:- start:1452 stop:2489 length:1038 start_codon:yes stop_codon:yes gene_type:complete
MPKFKILKRWIGDNELPLIIAEVGINHNGSLEAAIEIADAAISSGAEIIKHQTHVVSDEMIQEAKKIKPGNSNKSIYKIMNDCALNENDEKKLMKYILQKKKIFISSPFSREAVNRLVKFGVPAFKIGSGECNNYPLIEYIAKFKKPVILSTGMNSIQQIRKSVNIFRKKKIPFALLHCTNVYPTPPKLVRLPCLNTLKKNFPDAVVGLSDHTTSNYTSYAAMGLGAKIIERHFVDTRSRQGPDINCSMDPNDLKNLIEGSKIINDALKNKNKEAIKEELKTIKFAFASVVSIKSIKAGEKLNEKNIWVKRPGTGDFLANKYKYLLGKKVKKNIQSGETIKKRHF